MLPALLLILVVLAQTCVAPAVESIHTSSPLLDYAVPTNLSYEISNNCKDIDNCRTLNSIAISCLGTIFACIWVAVHRNIPGPTQSWLSAQLESTKLVLMTLLVPEWVLAWAVRQLLQARGYSKDLERARQRAEARTHEQQPSNLDMQSIGAKLPGPVDAERPNDEAYQAMEITYVAEKDAVEQVPEICKFDILSMSDEAADILCNRENGARARKNEAL